MPEPAPQQPAPAAVDETTTLYSLSEAAAQALFSLAAVAPGLSEAELKVCLYLCTIQDPHHHTARASSRQIAESTRVARSNVVRAIDALTRRCLIATRAGGGQQAAGYRLNFAATAILPSGPAIGPLAQTTLHFQDPPVVLSQAHQSGPQTALDIDTPDFEGCALDRTLTARPQHFQKSQLDHIRGYAYKWLLMQSGKPNANPPAPDDLVCAQIATAAGGVYHATDWIREHQRDYRASNYAYLVSAILQQFHGIAPQTTARRRRELQAVPRAKPRPNHEGATEPDADRLAEPPEPPTAQEIAQQIASLAQRKKIR